jgi:hypothetical protein
MVEGTDLFHSFCQHYIIKVLAEVGSMFGFVKKFRLKRK